MMGAWGTSLYANDTASDIRGDYADKLRRGKTNEEAVRELIDENRDSIGDAEEEPLFWFALADTQWNYGRLTPDVKAKALHFLSKEGELQRWEDSGQKLNMWKKTLEELREKLGSPQPDEKRVPKYRFYRCKWRLGDVFAYRFSGNHSAETGFKGKYIVFRKVSEDTWWPGHIVPVVQIYDRIFWEVPTINELSGLNLLPTSSGTPNEKLSYEIKLLSESKRSIPENNLVFLGNLPGDDLTPFRGYDYWTGYYPVGWEASRYNTKLERFVIDRYRVWHGEI